MGSVTAAGKSHLLPPPAPGHLQEPTFSSIYPQEAHIGHCHITGKKSSLVMVQDSQPSGHGVVESPPHFTSRDRPRTGQTDPGEKQPDRSPRPAPASRAGRGPLRPLPLSGLWGFFVSFCCLRLVLVCLGRGVESFSFLSHKKNGLG